jgi:hypothetical protein
MYNTEDEKEILEELKNKLYDIEKENTKLKLTLNDYGISEDEISEISDSEAICIKQLELLRQKSDEGTSLDEDDAKVFQIFNKQLLSIRGGSLGRAKKTAPGAQLSDDELFEKAKLLQLGKD